MSKKILLALTSNAELGDTGRKTGFYVPEAAHPYRVFRDAGFEVDFVSVKGGEPPQDGLKDDDPVQKEFLETEGERLKSTPSAGEVDSGEYDAVFYVGGHGTMWDLPDSEELARLAAEVYERGGVVAAVCHGPAGLVNIKLSDGSYLVAGKRVNSFTDEEEAAVGLDRTVPFLLQRRLQERGAKWEGGAKFTEYAVSDQRLVTGQNPASAEKTARLVVEALS
ncbi:type 1 glutamine amidotransferase domain-containing protein [Glycomyces tenuis]|uniref:type 1 glutamine amidotransferase domain-containing protein n=1 Tax=Glycomyces tenuis TaxID=58116 RepID=UPI00041592B7|nr:type 1 glutamine amidotransferase domain-containing protein [Glycomyces tenuis]